MFVYGKTSKARLATCHPKLQEIFNEAIKHRDITIIQGHRSIEEQKKFFEKGLSKCDGIRNLSNHNYDPARAVDVAPYNKGIDWEDIQGFIDLSDLVKKIAKKKALVFVAGLISKDFLTDHTTSC